MAEDSGASIVYRAVLGAAPTADVTLNITGGDQITVNGAAGSTSLTFTANNWWIPQNITVAAADDLLIEGNVPATIKHTFASSDARFEGLEETLSVNVIDNDFQRSLETSKLPSDGNNFIIYDFTGTSADYTYLAGNEPYQDKRYELKAGNDKLNITGSFQSDLKTTWFAGNSGDDTISGATMADGGEGNDTLTTFSTGVKNFVFRDANTNDSWNGSATSSNYVNYQLVGSWTTTRLAGNGGDDSITAGNVSLVAAGGSGSDSLTGSTTDDILWGDGFQVLKTSSRFDESKSRDGYRLVNGWHDAHQYYGETWFDSAVALNAGGNDSIQAGLGNDWVDGGGGNDTISGGLGNDTLVGSEGNDSIDGGDGSDQLHGGFGADTISGGSGNDTISSGDGKDLINTGDGNNYVDAGGDNDTITSGTGNDTLVGGDGDDSITSGLGNDSITAGDGADTVQGGIGDDTISGGLGNDSLYGNENNDSITGDEGNDSLYGGDGNDTLKGGSGNDRLEAGAGTTNTLWGEAGNDTLVGGSGNDSLDGGVNDDLISGDAGNDTLIGADGNDTLDGGAGSDLLSGGAGVDSLTGGDGDDTLIGSTGADLLAGGAGSDTFRYTGENLTDLPDTVSDFTAGSGGDKLDLNNLHAANPLVSFPAGDYPFSLGYTRLIQDGTDTLVAYDKDGFNSTHQAQTIARLIDVNALNLTPDNFVAGAASKNYGFQRNGAIISIGKGSDESKIKYQARLWGGAPSNEVDVRLSDKLGNELGTLKFNPNNWNQTQEINIAKISGGINAPTSLGQLNIGINSSDINYQGSGVTLGIVAGDLVAQRLPFTQESLPVFSTKTITRELTLKSTSNLQSKPLPSKIQLIPIKGNGGIVKASATIVDSSTYKLTLDSEPNGNAWVGKTTYLAKAEDAEGNLSDLNFRVSFSQTHNYTLKSTAIDTSTNEGSDSKISSIKVKAFVEQPALSDLTMGWSVNGAGTNKASADDFAGGRLPTGTVKIAKGETEAIIEIPIEPDSIQEENETFNISFRDESDQEINTKEATTKLTIVNDDLTKLSGIITYWKGSTPLDNVNIGIAKSIINASNDGTIQFRNINRNYTTNILTASLWADSGNTGFSNVDFNISKHNDTNFSITPNSSLFNSQWLTSINETSENYALSAISLAGNVGSVKIADITTSLPSEKTSTAYLSHGRVGDTLLQETHFQANESLSLSNGKFEFNATDGIFTAKLSKDPITGNERRAIDSRDALMALQMSSGAITANNLENQAQWIAADVDQNGNVQAKDAWLINKYTVGDSQTDVGTWEFVDSMQSLGNLSASNAAAPGAATISEINLSENSNRLSITAILNGDIDGSYINF